VPKKKNEDKCYAVVSNGRNFLHGAFPFTKEGRILAEKYAKTISPTLKDKPEIVVS
tara:strand:+ start:606 stop:773 length:168 start_codon:yes stop_codon:yes gene_type:complete